MTHRSPVGDGAWISPDCGIGPVHHRQAIVDRVEAARQPMSDVDEQGWVTFNGEICDHMTPRRTLKLASDRFRTDRSHPVVFLEGDKEWDIALLRPQSWS